MTRGGRIRNHTDFLHRYDQAMTLYRQRMQVLVERDAISKALDGLVAEALEESIEFHSRSYVIDAMLQALNWSIDENLHVEFGVRSPERGSRRRLDYLGTERDSLQPLLLVEAKRYSDGLPKLTKPLEQSVPKTPSELIADALSLLKSGKREAVKIDASWTEYLGTLIDYVRALPAAPEKVVITNGNWLVIFDAPVHSLRSQDWVSSDEVRVFLNEQHIRKSARDIFESLDYYRLAPFRDPVNVIDLYGSDLNLACLSKASYALRVTYNEVQTGLRAAPRIYLVPEIILYGDDGGVIRVTSESDFEIPHRPGDMPKHIGDINDAHSNLKVKLEQILSNSLNFVSVMDSYLDGDIAERRPIVEQIGASILVATGTERHFLMENDTHSNCPFHQFHSGGTGEPRRVCRRLQLLSRMEHHEQDDEQVFA